MTELLVFSFALLLGACFVGWEIGYRFGARHTASEIVRAFQQKITSTDNELNAVPALLGRSSLTTDGSLREIADKLHFAAWNEGSETESRINAPKADESSVTMPSKDLSSVAWLADLGFRNWIANIGERPTYEEAERLASVLDIFDRRIVPKLLAEPPDEKESRFNTSENRMHRVWRAYGKI
jgi:hypothetical protein